MEVWHSRAGSKQYHCCRVCHRLDSTQSEASRKIKAGVDYWH
jgi:hypothetical protein